MRLYHYTRYEYLRSILKVGLDSGEVCVAPAYHINAVWFTTSTSPQGHGRNIEKFALRIEVEIDRNDKRIRRYRHWAREIGVDRNFMKFMRHAAGPGSNDYNWYIYFGVIKPPFVSITDMASGGPVTAVPDDAPDMRGSRYPGSKLVSLADVQAGKIDLTYDLALHRLLGAWAA